MNQHAVVANHQVPDMPHRLNLVWLELTNVCNLECVHCYCEAGPNVRVARPLTHEEYCTVIDSVADYGCKEIQFIGGEPTLYKQLIPLIERVGERGIGLEIFTNATFLSEALLAACKRLNVRFATSFYSDKPQVHDAITTKPGSFEKTVNGITRIIAAGLNIRAEIILMKQNIGDLAAATSMLRSMGVSAIRANHQISVGRAVNEVPMPETSAGLCGRCGDGRIAIAPNGEIYPCIMSRGNSLGSIRSNSISEVMRGNMLKTFRKRFPVLSDSLVSVGRPSLVFSDPLRMDCSPNQACSPNSATPNDVDPHKPREENADDPPEAVPQKDCSPNQACAPNVAVPGQDPQSDGVPAPDDSQPEKDCSPNQACGPNFIQPDHDELFRDCSPNQACSPN
ncbi:radical SAM protein [Rhizobium deserti]|uniref:Radical SAM protein n=1 Tax=Rhizobium deserti TaxID=2547961 RepID=A0A4R5U6E2_9HYPH|nr:radical SAM protein [Rhizobium deserti]TDK29826.1 radical SAM protein [Rhizobium deserti]